MVLTPRQPRNLFILQWDRHKFSNNLQCYLWFSARHWCCVSGCTLQRTVQQPTQLRQQFVRLSASCLNVL